MYDFKRITPKTIGLNNLSETEKSRLYDTINKNNEKQLSSNEHEFDINSNIKLCYFNGQYPIDISSIEDRSFLMILSKYETNKCIDIQIKDDDSVPKLGQYILDGVNKHLSNYYKNGNKWKPIKLNHNEYEICHFDKIAIKVKTILSLFIHDIINSRNSDIVTFYDSRYIRNRSYSNTSDSDNDYFARFGYPECCDLDDFDRDDFDKHDLDNNYDDYNKCDDHTKHNDDYDIYDYDSYDDICFNDDQCNDNNLNNDTNS